MEEQKYLNSFSHCPKCSTRLLGNIKIDSYGNTVDLISLKNLKPDCRCTKCGQLFDSDPHPFLGLFISIVVLAITIPIVFSIASKLHVGLAIVLSLITMWLGMVLPQLLIPAYKPKQIKNPNQKLDPTRTTPAESGDIYSRAGQL